MTDQRGFTGSVAVRWALLTDEREFSDVKGRIRKGAVQLGGVCVDVDMVVRSSIGFLVEQVTVRFTVSVSLEVFNREREG